MATEPMLLTIREAAARLRIARSQAYDLARTGEIPAIRIRRSVRVPAAQLEAWIERQTKAPASIESPAGASGVDGDDVDRAGLR
jgi:excisionase family DNA binding protein